MATPSTTNRPTPERIFNTLNAYKQSAALTTGIDLDIFTAMRQHVLVSKNRKRQ